jgi:hypothetical protein
LSYVHGASGTPFIGDTIGVHFDRIVERFGGRDALIVCHQQIRWTYRELKERVDAFAAGLIALGLKRGDRIGVWSRARPTMLNGSLPNSRPQRPGSFSSTSTRPTGWPSSNTRSIRRAVLP